MTACLPGGRETTRNWINDLNQIAATYSALAAEIVGGEQATTAMTTLVVRHDLARLRCNQFVHQASQQNGSKLHPLEAYVIPEQKPNRELGFSLLTAE